MPSPLRFGMLKRDLGEGGTFALYQSLYPPADDDHEADRTLTVDSGLEKARSEAHSFFSIGKQRRISKRLQIPLLIWVSDN